MSIQDRIRACQQAIEFDATGAPMVIDGEWGPKTEAAKVMMLTFYHAGGPWPPQAAPAPAGAQAGSSATLSFVADSSSDITGTHNWSACLKSVPNRGSAPVAFLEELLAAVIPMPDSEFAPNTQNDIYDDMFGALGDPQDIPTRRAIMCEALRVTAGFESSWNWNCGVDTSAPAGRPMSAWETGAFQTSQNSLLLDPTGSLTAFLDSKWGAHDSATFIAKMKTDHMICVQFTAMLLRFSYQWDGPILRGEVSANVSPEAVQEWKSFLQPS